MVGGVTSACSRCSIRVGVTWSLDSCTAGVGGTCSPIMLT